ncbi:hypothetical protein FAES_1822 [Fibrella aestuarina BUZ 2]|uniref:Uncharacterized protein n=1 Tax=Fibrella aestuarina BUZ 2 TaxID=1166018 RepID=I0K6S9_9BACT|nr:hypothetical protein [Fibrella aestuarina]CCG99832.1 hypothetical protein FAES_1822 [Fibrella aestuarina BUZ 2]
MAKKLSELLPTDEVVLAYGAREEYDAGKRRMVEVEPEKEAVSTFAHFQELSSNEDDYDAETGMSQIAGRTVKIIGTPKYRDEDNPMVAGGKIKVLDKAVPLSKEKEESTPPPPPVE